MAKKARAPADTGRAGAAPADGGKVTKTSAVNAALREGLSSPTQIAAFVKEHYGLDMTPAHVSNIKSKGRTGGNGRKGGRGRKPGRPRAAEGRAPRPSAASGGLTANELEMLLQIARRMGGLQELRTYLDVLGRYQE